MRFAPSMRNVILAKVKYRFNRRSDLLDIIPGLVYVRYTLTLAAAGYVPTVTGEAPEVPRLLETKRPGSGPAGPDAAREG